MGPLGPPPDAAFPVGVYNFTITGAVGFGTTVTIGLPAGVTANAYYMYGPHPVGGTTVTGWFALPTWSSKAPSSPGVEFVDGGNILVLHLFDGKLGDTDGKLNGVITDPGAPAIVPPPPKKHAHGFAI